jgi:hypothetical protein
MQGVIRYGNENVAVFPHFYCEMGQGLARVGQVLEYVPQGNGVERLVLEFHVLDVTLLQAETVQAPGAFDCFG